MTKQQEATKPKILIVEDEAIVAFDLKSGLEKLGYTVLAHVNSAEKALELAEQNLPDLVLMDIVLKGKMDGIEVADIIRSRWDIPVVFCTSYADQERLGRAKLVTPFGYILKPFQDNDLKVTVELALYVSKVDMERRKAEEALRESEASYRNLFENANEAIFVSQDDKLVFLNPRTVMMTGYPAEELLSRPSIEFIHPDDRDMVIDRRVKRLKGEELPPIYDFRIIHKDGNVRWVELNAVVLNWKGRIATLNFLSDVTERKRAQKALQESEERFRSLYEQAPLGYQSLDAKGCLIEVNQSWLDLLGYARQEVIGRRFSDFLAPQEVEAFKQRFPIFKAKGEVHVDLAIMQRSGSTIIVHIDGKIGHDEQGRFKQTHCILNDITKQKQAEMRLRESEEKYRSLASAEDSMYLVDRECRFRFMNQAHMSRFGLSLDEIIGRSYGEFHSEEESKQFASIVKEVFETNTSLQVEHKSEKEPKYFLRTFSPIRDSQGSVTAVTVISKDITERKEAEKALFKSEKLYHSLFENMMNGFAYCRMLFKEGQPEDFIYLAVNPAFEAQTGLKNVVGKKVSEVIPGGRESDPQLFEIYSRVSLTGNPERFEFYLKALKQWFFLSVFSLEKEHFVAVFDVITERKQAEQKLLQYQQQLQSLSIRLSEVEETQRKEIARTLHDLVGQNLTALNLNLTIILGMISEDQNPLLVSRLEDSQKLLEETTQYIREVMSALRPSVLDNFGLTAGLRWVGRRFNSTTGIQTNVEGEDFSPRFPPLLEIIIFRIAQEALTNVLKHASAEKVDLRIEKVEDKVRLTITDDGQGFIFKGFRLGGAKRGWGLAMMRERAVALGGDFQIYTEPGKGTRIILELPVER